MAANRPTRIAFVDAGNTGRSVTAEALAIAVIGRSGLNAQVISRGVDRNPYNIRAEANFVTLLDERAIDIASHVATQFGPQDARFSDLVLTMTLAHKSWLADHFPDAAGKVYTLTEYVTGAHRDIPDALGQTMAFYRTVLERLDQLIEAAMVKATAKP